MTTAVIAHLAHLIELNRRTGTIEQRRYTLARLGRFADAELLELDLVTLRLFVNQPQLGVEARSAAVTHLRGFFGWAVEEELIAVDPTARLRRPKRERRLPRPMPDEDASTALGNAEEPIKAWLYLAAYAGLRAFEMAPFRGEDCLLNQSPRVLIVRDSKGGDTTFVPLSVRLLPVVTELPRRGFWFPSGPRGQRPHVSASQVSKRTNLYLHELGIEHSLHTLRHWYGTQAYRTTHRDLRATQELMRHKSPASTAGYTYIDPGENALAVDALPALA